MPAPEDDLSWGARSQIRNAGQELQAISDSFIFGYERPSVTPLNHQLDRIEEAATSFYDNDFQDTYRRGAIAAGHPDYQPKVAEQEWLDRRQRDAHRDIEQTMWNSRRDARRLTDESRRFDSALNIPERQHIRGRRYRGGDRVSPDAYLDMHLATNSAVAYNRGYIQAAMRAGKVSAFEIVDSPNCGLTSHADGVKANGMIVNAADAQAYLISHPHCQRRFIARPDLTVDGRVSDLIRRVAKINGLALSANALVAGASLLTNRRLSERVIGQYLRSDSILRAFVEPLRRLQEQLTRIVYGTGRQIDDVTGDVVKIRVSERQVLDHVADYEDDVMEGRRLPDHIAAALGMTGTEDVAAMQFRFDKFMEYRDIRLSLLEADEVVEEIVNLNGQAQQALYDWLGPLQYGDQWMRLSMPNLGGTGRRPRVQLLPENQAVRASLSLTQNRGIVPDVRLNPNGLIRAGFQYDPTSGRFFPNLSVIPDGPLRIETRINRSGGFRVLDDGSNLARAKQFARQYNIPIGEVVPGAEIGTGKITSLSVKIRLITKMDGRIARIANPTLLVRLNLRELGLDSLADIRRLSLDDFRRLRLNDVKIVSLASEFWLKGRSVFDFRRNLRINFEEAEKIWELGKKRVMANYDFRKRGDLPAGRIPIVPKTTRRDALVDAALEKGIKVTDQMQNLISTIEGLSQGRLTVDADIIKTELIRRLRPLRVNVLRQRVQDELTYTAERIENVLNSSRKAQEMIILVRDMQLEMLGRLNLHTYIERFRVEILDFFKTSVPSAIRPTADILEFRIRSIFDRYAPMIGPDGVVPNRYHNLSEFQFTDRLNYDLTRVADMIEDMFPNAPHSRWELHDIQRVFYKDDGTMSGPLGLWRPAYRIDNGRVEWIMSIDEQVKNGWDQGPLRATMEKFIERGWIRSDRADPAYLLIHEYGHHLSLTMPEADLAHVLREVIGDLSGRKGRAWQRFLETVDEDPKSAAEAYWRVSSKKIRAGISEYGASEWEEGLAELFVQGLFNRQPTDLAKKYVTLMEEYWGPTSVRRSGLLDANIPLGPGQPMRDGTPYFIRDFKPGESALEQTRVRMSEWFDDVIDGVDDLMIRVRHIGNFMFRSEEWNDLFGEITATLRGIDDLPQHFDSMPQAQEMYEAADRLSEMFPRMASMDVRSRWEADIWQGQFWPDRDQIEINRRWFEDSGLYESMEKDLTSGWHPPIDSVWSPATATMVHEYGHAIASRAYTDGYFYVPPGFDVEDMIGFTTLRDILFDIRDHAIDLHEVIYDSNPVLFERKRNDITRQTSLIISALENGYDPIFSRRDMPQLSSELQLAVRDLVGDYASENLSELLAELFTEGMLSSQPSSLALRLRDMYLELYG
jgi:hypothetical protein